jgi:[ribosomal protein S18]-alanine N-acetyltransferase
MAVLQRIKELFIPLTVENDEEIVPAPMTEYEIRPLTEKHLREILRLNVRCFQNGDSYTKGVFQHLLTVPDGLSYQITTAEGQMVGFIFLAVDQTNIAHITTIGVAPEHRRRGLAVKLLKHAEDALRARNTQTVFLEVRVSNFSAHRLYHRHGYFITQRVKHYYTNGEDCYMMVKPL